MQLLASWWKSLDPIVAYVSFCFAEPMYGTVCRPFWTWVVIGVFAFGLLMLLMAVWHLVAYQLKVKAALRAQQERDRVADEETLASVRWVGDDVLVGAPGRDNVEGRIRDALDQRRAGNA